jgi:hypothetical protein
LARRSNLQRSIWRREGTASCQLQRLSPELGRALGLELEQMWLVLVLGLVSERQRLVVLGLASDLVMFQ